MGAATKRFDGRKVMIFGGNSGIGRAAAEGFAAEGAEVAVTGRDEATLAEVAAAVPGLHTFRSDIGDIAATRATVDQAAAALGGFDVVFVNAGIGVFEPAERITEALWDQVTGINLKGCFFAAQACLPHLRDGGAIVFTGSIGSLKGLPGNTVYAAAKAGLRAVARILAAELVVRNIRVNMVSPGPTETPIIRRNIGQAPGVEDMLRRQMIAAVPMHRMGEAEEVARAVLFLASPEASFITGIDLFVDGGCIELVAQ
ncbi:MAG: SDR family oxidoreductase [Sphingomonas fennica]